jgi:hypothetical protein
MEPRELPAELQVLRDVSRRLDEAGIAFMVTGSFALTYYAVPRMTRDIDLVVDLADGDVEPVLRRFEPDYYVSHDAAREAIANQSSFNLIHLAEVVKVDFIPRRGDPYHLVEFGRRRRISLGDFATWVVSREDLVLAKLLWARESRSEIQLADVRSLVGPELDVQYVEDWASRLGLTAVWRTVAP